MTGEREVIAALPLFPLRSVLFPGGLLPLKVFEARYVDLVADCLRRQQPFGVVCLLQGGEVRPGKAAVHFEGTGVLARLDDVDSEQPGVLQARCTATRRFRLEGKAVQQDDGRGRAGRVGVEVGHAQGPTVRVGDLGVVHRADVGEVGEALLGRAQRAHAQPRP